MNAAAKAGQAADKATEKVDRHAGTGERKLFDHLQQQLLACLPAQDIRLLLRCRCTPIVGVQLGACI